MDVGSLEEFIDENHCIVSTPMGPEYYVNILSFVDKDQLEPGSSVLMHHKNLSVIGILADEVDPLVSVMKVDKAPLETYSDIGGLEEQIQEMKEAVELPLTHPELYEDVGIKPPKGVILYGVPGTGKTLLAKAVANETSATFLRVVGSELIQKYLGDGPKLVREMFRVAQALNSKNKREFTTKRSMRIRDNMDRDINFDNASRLQASLDLVTVRGTFPGENASSPSEQSRANRSYLAAATKQHRRGEQMPTPERPSWEIAIVAVSAKHHMTHIFIIGAVLSTGTHKESISHKFGRSSSALADRVTVAVDEVGMGDKEMHLNDEAWKTHAAAQKLAAHRRHSGVWKHAAATNVQQALRMERAANQADAILLHISEDKNARRPSRGEGWLLDYASPAAAAQVEGGGDPDESFSIARKMPRKTLTRFLITGNNNIPQTFCKWCNQQRRAEPRPAFKDARLEIEPGKAAVGIRKSPEVNCYAHTDLSTTFKPPAADAGRHDPMMATLYGDDVEPKEIECIGEALALKHQRQPPRARSSPLYPG
ncbi:unnamed protein product [Prorocentrum cordatum]|uniref:AAA+ ATPase domain-containing protein n=1 Tax=Prorocentrum cordatum TaxID=2364126 RepID=A0ABN9X0D1_9DINO|nr:unnamed protein product [Polarella glacialis]